MGLFMYSRQQEKPAGSHLRDDAPLWRSSAKRGGQLALLCLLRGDLRRQPSQLWGCRLGGVNRQAIARAISLHKSQEQRQNLSRS